MAETSELSGLPEKIAPEGRVSIPLVDDLPANLLALEAILGGLGHDLVEARSGEEALRRLAGAEFALVLLDVQMPGMDGFETARLIRGREESRRTPIIFLSASESDRFPVEEAYSLGAVDYLVKPLSPVILRAKVAGFVDLFEKNEKIRRMERRQFEDRLAEENARLRESEKRFRTLASHAPVGIFQTDAHGNCQFVNERWCELAGLSPEQAEGRGWVRALHPEDRERIFHDWYSAAESGHEFASEYRFQTPLGKVSWLQGSAVPLLNDAGEVTGYLGTNTDISDRKLAEDALKEADRGRTESLALLDTLQHNAPVGFAFVDRQFRYVRINEALAAINGKTAAEHLGRTVEETIPSLWPRLEPLYRGVLEKDEPVINQEFTGESPSSPGQIRHWLVSYYPVRVREEVVGVGVLVADMTERKQVEEALREVEARFTAILNHSPSCIFAKDRQGRYLLANKALGEFTGRDAADLLGRTDADLFPAEVAARFAGDDADLLASGRPRIYEESFPHADSTVTALTVKFPLAGADGTPYAVCGIATDISDRKRAQDALRESERRWRSLAEALPNLVWTDLPDGQCDYLSGQWGTYTGIPENELLGLAWLERVIHPDDRERTLACWMAAVEDKAVYDLEYRIRRHDGQYRWFKTRGVPIRDGQGRIVKWFGTCTDIEDQKRVMEELRQSEERFARFMQHLPGLAWVKDSQGRYVYANDAALKAFRRPRNDLFGKTDAEVFPAEAAARFEENDRRALASGTGVQVVETLEHGDGIVHHSVVSKFPIPGRDGRPALVGGVAIDITDLKRAEEALRDADRRKDEFLATLAHELRNPLAPIRNSLQILKMPRVDAATVQRSRDMMDRQVEQLVRLVDDLLDVSRVMRGKIELRRERVELATVVARAVETVQPLVDAQGHQLSVSLPPESLPLDADPVRLAQVVGNLLTNAAKYTEPNGHIWITAAREDNEAVLRIRDSGIGIAPDVLPRIFDLFVQVDHAAARSQGGLGIGLTLVKNLCEMHGGSVEARSAGLGRGSEFVVRLPLVAQDRRQPQEGAGEGRQEPARSSGHRLLVVDDNRDAADSLAVLLRLQGHEVRVAHGGPAALEMTKGYAPDMVFLDIGMPGMDGYEVARRMRPLLGGVVLVALTGWGTQEDRRRSAEAGFDHHLVKPVEPKALEGVLADPRLPRRSGEG
jgi:PAS domain S-box-containing protein